MSSLRLRRLQADFQNLRDVLSKQPRIRLVEARGNPPEQYKLEYHVRSLKKQDDTIVAAGQHIVEISLPRDYPKVAPHCRMLSPVFHPNIAPHAICVGDHWSVGEPLWSIVMRIGEMLAYQAYNTKSPLNGEAARWADENEDRLPLDPIQLLVAEPVTAAAGAGPVPQTAAKPAATSAPKQPAPEPRDAEIPVSCPACQSKYRVAAKFAGREFKCSKCQAPIRVPASPTPTQSATAPAPKSPTSPVQAPASNGAVRAQCPQCNAPCLIPQTLLGKPIACPKCRRRFIHQSAGAHS